MFNQHKIKLQFLFELSELDYIQNSIDFLVSHYQDDFKKFDDEYKKELENLKSSGDYANVIEYGHTEGDFFEEYGMDRMHEFETISETMISSILIRQVSFVEKLLIELSFIIYRQYNCPVAPNYNSGKHFTDCLKAVEYIELVSGQKINLSENWDKFVKLRDLRHRLAHGNTYFTIKKSDFEIYNNLFKDNKRNKVFILKEYKIGLENDKYISCKINPVLENLSYFNISFKLFIEEIKNIFICYEELER